MTVRDAYEACLIELNKVQAPSLLVEDFVYLLNKNIQEYFNKKYNNFEKIQLSTDDLRQLINYVIIDKTNGLSKNSDIYDGGSWKCILPADYVHILGCRAKFITINKKKCKPCGPEVVGVNKLDTNQFPLVFSNYYMRPSHSRPYYLIININQGNTEIPTLTPNSLKEGETRYGNSLESVLLIICGNEPDYQLESVEILYLLAPRYVTLSQDDLDQIDDHTLVLEFADYVCNEIIKQLVNSILENLQNPRIQTYDPVNKSIPQ